MRPGKTDWGIVLAVIVFMLITLCLARAIYPILTGNFSTINRTTSSIGTARSMPTQTPGPSPTPTSTPPAIMRTGDFGILSQRPCGPPCFQGITPGVTTFDEAALILKNAGFPCSVEEGSHGKVLLCGGGDKQISLATYGPCSLQSTGAAVGGITLTPPNKLTVGKFITQYGAPDSMSAWGRPTLSYQSLQTFVFPPLQGRDQTYTFTPGTPIEVVAYATAAEYQACRQMSIGYEQSWTGYGTYTLFKNP